MKELAEYWAPSVARSIPQGETETFEFRGLSGDLFAANRFLIGAADPSALNQISVTAKTNQGRDLWFENIQAAALKNLFEQRSFAGGIVIEDNKALLIEVTNNSQSTQWISVTLNGYDQPVYEEKISQYKESGRKIPMPQFAYGTALIPAGADQQRIVMSIPAVDTDLYRLSLSSTGDDDLLVSFNVNNKEIFQQRFLSAVNDEFRNMHIIEPVRLKKNLQFEALVTNLDPVQSRSISIIAETYKVQ